MTKWVADRNELSELICGVVGCGRLRAFTLVEDRTGLTAYSCVDHVGKFLAAEGEEPKSLHRAWPDDGSKS